MESMVRTEKNLRAVQAGQGAQSSYTEEQIRRLNALDRLWGTGGIDEAEYEEQRYRVIHADD